MRVGNERYPITPGFTGVVETVARNADHFVLSGWAADLANGRPAEAVVATIGERVVTKWFPGTIRVDNEAIYGPGIRPSNFVMRVNGVLPADASLLRVFALMKDGRAVQLFSTNPLVAGSFVSLPVIGEVNGETLSIDGSDYAIVERMAGSLEMATAAYPGFVVHGWAADLKANRPVSALVAAVGSTLVARAAPTMARTDIEANISAGARPAGFVINVPVGRDAGTDPDIRVDGGRNCGAARVAACRQHRRRFRERDDAQSIGADNTVRRLQLYQPRTAPVPRSQGRLGADTRVPHAVQRPRTRAPPIGVKASEPQHERLGNARLWRCLGLLQKRPCKLTH